MKRTTYHHGALRDALMTACLRLIEAEGIVAVSLRRVAREAGVSSGAPYHHFPDRASLLAALSTQGFELLSADLAAARAASTDSPLDTLAALAAAYVGFSQKHPAHFRLMFRPELSQPEKHPATLSAGDTAFAILTDTIADCVAAGMLPDDKADVLGITFWGLAHGMSSLWLDGQLDKRSSQLGTSTADLVNEVMRTVAALMAPAP